jgi:hypothetical protein
MPKGQSEAVNRRRTDSKMDKRKRKKKLSSKHLSPITMDMFRLSQSQSGPFPIHDLSPSLQQE